MEAFAAVYWSTVFIGLLVEILIVAFFAGYVASTKGRSAVGWFLLTVLFNLPALIAIAGVPSEN